MHPSIPPESAADCRGLGIQPVFSTAKRNPSAGLAYVPMSHGTGGPFEISLEDPCPQDNFYEFKS